MNIETKLNEYRPLPGFSCPAEFWPALGYEGTARYVAIYWEPAGDEAAWSDGYTGFAGAGWPAYQALLDHNFPLDHPARWLTGSSESAATVWLVIDRMTEWAWLVPTYEAWEVLWLQYSAEERQVVSAVDLRAELAAVEALEAAVARMMIRRGKNPIVAALTKNYERHAAFQAALRRRAKAEG